MHTYLPVDFCGTYSEAAMVRRLGDADPDYIVINSRDVRKYGKRGLGSDYGLGVADWINRHDRVLRDFRTSDYLVRVFERNETASQLDGE